MTSSVRHRLAWISVCTLVAMLAIPAQASFGTFSVTEANNLQGLPAAGQKAVADEVAKGGAFRAVFNITKDQGNEKAFEVRIRTKDGLNKNLIMNARGTLLETEEELLREEGRPNLERLPNAAVRYAIKQAIPDGGKVTGVTVATDVTTGEISYTVTMMVGRTFEFNPAGKIEAIVYKDPIELVPTPVKKSIQELTSKGAILLHGDDVQITKEASGMTGYRIDTLTDGVRRGVEFDADGKRPKYK